MSFISKLAGVAIVGAMSVMMAAPAYSASCDTSCGVVGLDGQLLDSTNSVVFSVEDIQTGAFTFSANFDNQSTNTSQTAISVFRFAPTSTFGTILNLTLTFTNPALGSFAITDGSGASTAGGANDVLVSVDLTSNPGTIDFELAGTSVAGSKPDLLPGFDVVISAVPVPAALPLFASALLGLGLLSRRRRNR